MIEPKPDAAQLLEVKPLEPAAGQPAWKAERLGKVFGGINRWLGKDSVGQAPKAPVRVGHGRRTGCRLQFGGEHALDAAQHAVQKSRPSFAADCFGQGHSLVDSRVGGNRVKEYELVGAELQQCPQLSLDPVSRALNERSEDRVERGFAADDAVRQLHRQAPLVGRREGPILEKRFKQSRYKAAAVLVLAQYGKGDVACA